MTLLLNLRFPWVQKAGWGELFFWGQCPRTAQLGACLNPSVLQLSSVLLVGKVLTAALLLLNPPNQKCVLPISHSRPKMDWQSLDGSSLEAFILHTTPGHWEVWLPCQVPAPPHQVSFTLLLLFVCLICFVSQISLQIIHFHKNPISLSACRKSDKRSGHIAKAFSSRLFHPILRHLLRVEIMVPTFSEKAGK